MLYVGSNGAVIDLLQQALGAQFAGGGILGAMATAYEITGDEAIPSLLQRLPAFAIVSSSMDGSGTPGDPVIEGRLVPSADIRLFLQPEEVAVRSGGDS